MHYYGWFLGAVVSALMFYGGWRGGFISPQTRMVVLFGQKRPMLYWCCMGALAVIFLICVVGAVLTR